MLGRTVGPVGFDPDGVGDRRAVGAGELTVRGEQQPLAAVDEVGEGVEAREQGRRRGHRCG